MSDEPEPELSTELHATLDYNDADRFSQVPDRDQHLLSKDDPRRFDSNDANGDPYQGGQAGRESQQSPELIVSDLVPLPLVTGSLASSSSDAQPQPRPLPAWSTNVDRYVASTYEPKELERDLKVREYQENALDAAVSLSSLSSTVDENPGWQRNVRPRIEAPAAPVELKKAKTLREIAHDVHTYWKSQDEEERFMIYLQYLIWHKKDVPIAFYITKPQNCNFDVHSLSPSKFMVPIKSTDTFPETTVTIDLDEKSAPKIVTWTETKAGDIKPFTYGMTVRYICNAPYKSPSWMATVGVFPVDILTQKAREDMDATTGTLSLTQSVSDPRRFSKARCINCDCADYHFGLPSAVLEMDLTGEFMSPIIIEPLQKYLPTLSNDGVYPLIELVLEYFGSSVIAGAFVPDTPVVVPFHGCLITVP